MSRSLKRGNSSKKDEGKEGGSGERKEGTALYWHLKGSKQELEEEEYKRAILVIGRGKKLGKYLG